jgi:hypothetical protein
LPAPAPWQPLPADGGRLTLPVLARLLVSAAGRRFLDSDRRWSPSGGNLGSISAWLVHGFGAGLPAAPLRLDDRTAELVARTAEPLLPGELLAATDLEAPAAGAVVVLVVELSRVLTKYGRFAYRLVHLDSGCAALQLGLVAQEYGLEVHFASRWDGTVGPRLGLDPAREAIVAIATVAIAVLEEG